MIADACKAVGYRAEIGYNQFLYVNEGDIRKVRPDRLVTGWLYGGRDDHFDDKVTLWFILTCRFCVL